MIIYFSATGNTRYIARQLARLLDDECLDLTGRIQSGDHSPIHSDKPFVICAPVYVCEVPRFLTQYLKSVALTGSKDVYLALTSGGYCGIAGPWLQRTLRKKGMNCRGYAEFVMPRNYVASDAYPMLDPGEVERRLKKAHAQILPAARIIRSGAKLPKPRHVFLFEYAITLPLNPFWVRHKLLSRDFYATDRCIGCGKCVRVCPLGNITLSAGQPVWSDQCTHCMACIGSCPVSAIEYGQITPNKEKYHIDRYRHVLQDLPELKKEC